MVQRIDQLNTTVKTVLRDCKAILKGINDGLPVNQYYVIDTVRAIRAILKADREKDAKLF